AAPHRRHPAARGAYRSGSRRSGWPQHLSMTPRTISTEHPLVAIVGATGTGKSELSLDLAEALVAHGETVEIVNADAMQLYRGMDIGTAKLTVDERRGIPHHMLDVLEVTHEAAVAWYQDAAQSAIAGIHA